MKLNQFKVLSQEEIEKIHSATLELLRNVGVKIDCKKTRKLLEDYGANVDHDTNFVKYPESLVIEKLRQVPSSFKLYGPDGNSNIEVNLNSTHFLPIGTPVKIYAPEKNKGVRKSTLEDTIKQMRLVDQSEFLSCSTIDFWPNDIKYTTIHAQCLYQWVHNCRKPYGFGCFGKMVSQDAMNMTAIIAGGEDEIRRHPRMFGIFNPTSPLHLPKLMTNGLAIFAEYEHPLIIAPEALGGTSAPVTLAGLITQTNAEILSTIILAQIHNPGTPVMYGTVSHTTDMRSGNSAIGGIETGLITAGMAQLAHYYNIPSRSLGAVTDSKCLDLQNGVERFQTLLFAALSGINFITCAGNYEVTLSGSFELTTIDNELAGMVLRAIEGIEISDETIGLDVISKVAQSKEKGVNYLSERHTRNYMKKELFMPHLFDRDRRATWRKKGSKNIIQSAKEKVEKILKNFSEYQLDNDIEKDLRNYMKNVEERSYEYYSIAEGLTRRDVSLPDEV
ncbi:MAG: hypothetical protein GF383_12545 [Candidatus Lokiarchaeota archaeon]|nr:hypothetical protein [Candidatus Lokiarchaeota archaeon]MBD3341854.1 hypothetical protein [Candidatus Lokiarchaeota archaeon]